MGVIIPRMPRKRPRRIFVERLLQLDLIQDKRQCRKKKQRVSKSDGNNSDKSDSKYWRQIKKTIIITLFWINNLCTNLFIEISLSIFFVWNIYFTGSSSSESSDESDSDSNVKVRSPKANVNIKKSNKRKADARKGNTKNIELTASEIAKLLVEAVDSGKYLFNSALKKDEN